MSKHSVGHSWDGWSRREKRENRRGFWRVPPPGPVKHLVANGVERVEPEGFEQRLAYGVNGEAEVARRLSNFGMLVFTLEQFETKQAPYATLKGERLTFTDFMVSDGDGFWLGECKRSGWDCIDGERHIGFSAKAYSDYKRLREKSGSRLVIYFLVEKDQRGLYYAELGDLGKPLKTKKHGQEWVLWHKDLLRRL